MNKKPLTRRPAGKPATPVKKASSSSNRGNNRILAYGIMMMLFMVSILIFSPIVNHEFINTWDDGAYVIDNPLLKDISWKGIVNMFRYGDDFQLLINNYHPVTILSLALNYQVSGLSPSSYLTVNMLFHGFNAVLAFIFIYLLSRRKIWPAVISGLLFAVHPMHVESVAWVSERKDVLYAFFFLAGLIAYLKYLEDEKLWKLALALMLFIFSCLSKAMAVPFPLIMLLIDYLQRRRFTWRLAIEKVPFFIIAIAIGLMSVNLQSTSAINKFETFTIFQRIMHASYGFLTYIQFFIYPHNLSAFYPYPAITSSGLLPLSYRIAPYICLLIAALLIWLFTRKGENSRIIIFGTLFYFLTIVLVLQFLSVGKAIMADRYTYIPYIGLSFIVGMFTDYFLHQKTSRKYIGYAMAGLIVIMSIVFSFMTYERAKIWKDDIELWTDVLRKYDGQPMNFIYEKRARKYLESKQYEASLNDYQTIVANDPRDVNALESVGRIYGRYLNDLGKAVVYLEKAHAVDPENPVVLKSLGVAMGMKGNFRESLGYLLRAYEFDKTDTNLVRNIAGSYHYLGMQEKAAEFDRLAESMARK